jgi:hypothetical protein
LGGLKPLSSDMRMILRPFIPPASRLPAAIGWSFLPWRRGSLCNRAGWWGPCHCRGRRRHDEARCWLLPHRWRCPCRPRHDGRR